MHVKNNELIPDGIGDYYYGDDFHELDSYPIYYDEIFTNDNSWIIDLTICSNNIFFLRIFQCKYIDSDNYINPHLTRISLYNPEYIIFPDDHHIFSFNEREKFISIINSNWNKILIALDNEIDDKALIKDISMPDYTKLPVEG